MIQVSQNVLDLRLAIQELEIELAGYLAQIDMHVFLIRTAEESDYVDDDGKFDEIDLRQDSLEYCRERIARLKKAREILTEMIPQEELTGSEQNVN